MSSTVTQGVRIEVESIFVPEQSSPDEHQYLFAYHVTITNEGDEPVQLVSRHWVITDGAGRVEQVRGAGVVGKQPRLKSGESFDYTSACPLRTPVGTMEGTYQMVRADGSTFDARIAPFTLACPEALN